MMRKLKFIYRHHVVLRVKLYVLREETFLLPVKYIDVTRTTFTSLDVMGEKNIGDYCNVDEDRELSDAWTGVTRFVLLKERPPEGKTWSGGRRKRKQTISRPDDVARDVEISCPMQRKREQNKVGSSRNLSSTMPDK